MFFSDNINKITFSLYEPTVDMILHSLELYAYNLHFIVKKNSEDYNYCNLLILQAYNEILSNYRSQKYVPGYNLQNNCKLEIERYKRKNYYEYKNQKKYSA